jgi:Na+/H+ antiporter NhaD/arsenite permease-like protein
MDSVIVVVFLLVYLGMVLGRLPGLALDRTGVALLGAISLVAAGRVTPQDAWRAVDVSTVALLFGLMVISAQFRLGGMYAAVTRKLSQSVASPERLLIVVIGSAAALSALLANDVVCLAVAPLIVEACARRGLRPMPFLLALACASNVGSAATLIGNPQNMLIGQALRVSFPGYLLDGVPPAVAGCAVIWVIIRRQARDSRLEAPERVHIHAPEFNAWQTAKGGVVLFAVILCFLFSDWPREVVALAGAGLLLMSRRMHSRVMLALVDWHLLVLFFGLFVVNDALTASGALRQATGAIRNLGIDVSEPAWLFGATALLSNLVSNVPAVMLLLPTADHPQAGAVLALASTLAGNLFIVGSIANIIVVDQAGRLGVHVSWKQHARIGVPVTAATLALAAGWLYLRSL